jgi:hypothetical protein
MVLVWPPFRIISDDPTCQPRYFFSPLTLPGEFLNIFYMNYAFDLTQNIAKTNIYTCCSSSNICICCSLCGFYRVEYCIATSGLGWLVHFKVHYQKSQSKIFWVILCAYLLIAFLQKLITSICPTTNQMT